MMIADRFNPRSKFKFALVVTTVLQLILTSPNARAASTAKTPKATDTSAAAAPSPIPDSGPDVLVSENRSVLQYASGYTDWNPFGNRDGICTSFYVLPHADAVQRVMITSTGLGLATFKVDEGGAGSGGCPKSTDGEQSHLLLPMLDTSKRILIRIPGNEVPELGNAIEGKILVVTPKQKPQEVPIKVENPASAFRTAWLWVWGILVPGAITFVFGYAAVVANNWYMNRKTQSDVFRKYKDDNYSKLKDFFTGPYAISVRDSADDRTFAQAVRDDLTNEALLTALPGHKRRKLERLLGKCNGRGIKAVLVALFPEWKDAILVVKEDKAKKENSENGK